MDRSVTKVVELSPTAIPIIQEGRPLLIERLIHINRANAGTAPAHFFINQPTNPNAAFSSSVLIRTSISVIQQPIFLGETQTLWALDPGSTIRSNLYLHYRFLDEPERSRWGNARVYLTVNTWQQVFLHPKDVELTYVGGRAFGTTVMRLAFGSSLAPHWLLESANGVGTIPMPLFVPRSTPIFAQNDSGPLALFLSYRVVQN